MKIVLMGFLIWIMLGLTSAALGQLSIFPAGDIELDSDSDTVIVPLKLYNPDEEPIDAFGFILKYPTHTLEFLHTDNVGTLTEDWIIASGQENLAGIVTIGGFHTTPLSSSGVLINVVFLGSADCIGDTLVLADFKDDLKDALTTPGVITPVELAFFSATVVNQVVQLIWYTESETNNLGFEIERSHDNRSFSSIGVVAGHGTTFEKHEYQFKDENAGAGIHYYRLKQIDTDGKAHYSPSIHVNVLAPRDVILYPNYPNPFNPATTIEYELSRDSHIHMAIYSTTGQRVKKLVDGVQNTGQRAIRWDGSDDSGLSVAAGLYLCRLVCGDETRTIKLILAR